MSRPITLSTGQPGDLPFEEVARLASPWGYGGPASVRAHLFDAPEATLSTGNDEA